MLSKVSPDFDLVDDKVLGWGGRAHLACPGLDRLRRRSGRRSQTAERLGQQIARHRPGELVPDEQDARVVQAETRMFNTR